MQGTSFVKYYLGRLLLIFLSMGLCVGCATTHKVATASMEPTLLVGQSVEAETVTLVELERGDIILFEDSSNADELKIKRLIALPNETIEITNGTVSVNGTILEENYPISPAAVDQQFGPLELGENEYFVLGDNRPNSFDSRQFGGITGEKILGRVLIP